MGEKINYLDQNLGMVRNPGRFPLTSGWYGADSAVDLVPSLPSFLVWMMGDESMICHPYIAPTLTSKDLVNLLKHDFGIPLS